MDIRTIRTFQTVVKLLERGKKLQLTEAGRLFHQNADVLLKNYDFLSLTMTELIQGEAVVCNPCNKHNWKKGCPLKLIAFGIPLPCL